MAGEGEGHACGFLFNFSKVTENAIVTIRQLSFFHIFSDVAIGSENSPAITKGQVIWSRVPERTLHQRQLY